MATDRNQISPRTTNEVQRTAQSCMWHRPEDAGSSPEVSCRGGNRSKRRSRHPTLHRTVYSEGQGRAGETRNAIPEGMGRKLGATGNFGGEKLARGKRLVGESRHPSLRLRDARRRGRAD